MSRIISRNVACLVVLLGLTGCGGSYVRSELYFGSARAGAADITPAQWQAFVDEVITPRFPNGLTILEGNGQWLMKDGSLAKEKSRVVILVHPGTDDERRKLDEIREAYKAQFSQEAVLEIDEDAEVRF